MNLKEAKALGLPGERLSNSPRFIAGGSHPQLTLPQDRLLVPGRGDP